MRFKTMMQREIWKKKRQKRRDKLMASFLGMKPSRLLWATKRLLNFWQRRTYLT